MSKFTSGRWEACVDDSVDIKDASGRVVDVYSLRSWDGAMYSSVHGEDSAP